MAPVPGPPLRNQRSALVLPAAKTEKPAANSEARAPLETPGLCGGAPETVCVSRKATALCYNTLSFLPERLIRAPVLKPRPRSQAGRSMANTRLTRSPDVSGRFVGAACMRPVNLPLPPVPGIIDAIPGVCRGGIYASRQGYMVMRGLRETRPYTPHIIKIKKIIGSAGEIARPTGQDKQQAPRQRAMAAMFAGGIYAAPTHGPNAVTTKKRVRWVYGCGPHACGPWAFVPRGVPGWLPVCPPVLKTRRAARNTTIFHFYFLIFNLNLNFSNFYFSRASSAAPMTPAR